MPTSNGPREAPQQRGLGRFGRRFLSVLLLIAVAVGLGGALGHRIWPEDPYFAQIAGWFRLLGNLAVYLDWR